MNPTRTVHPAGTLQSSTFQNVQLYKNLQISNIKGLHGNMTPVKDEWVSQATPLTGAVDYTYHISFSDTKAYRYKKVLVRRTRYYNANSSARAIPVVPAVFEGQIRKPDDLSMNLSSVDISFLKGNAPVAYAADMSDVNAPYCEVAQLIYHPASQTLRAIAWARIIIGMDSHRIYAAYSRQNPEDDILSWWVRSRTFKVAMFVPDLQGGWDRHEVLLRGKRLLKRLGDSHA